MTNEADRETLGAVRRARARLARIAGRILLRERASWALGAGAVAAALRPIVFRLGDDAPRWAALARSAGFFAAGAAAAAALLLVLGRRRRPSEVGAARAVDEALGLREVVASGLAFARDGRDEPLVQLARRRAAEASAKVDVEALFPLPSLRPSLRSVARFAMVAAMAIAVGSYDRGLVTALVSPPTRDEKEAASDLEEAARELATQVDKKGPDKPHDPPAPGREKGDDKGGERGPSLSDMAREAARAAKRGDRKGALEKLQGVRSVGEKQASKAQGIGSALRKMAEALDASPGKAGAGTAGKPVEPSASAAESMRLLAQKMRSGESGSGSGETSNERVLERLERAGEEARRAAASGDRGAGEAARALSRAAAALNRGDRAAAAQALEEAASRAAAMESAREEAAAEAMAIAEMLERSGALERAVQMALLGREGRGGKGEGSGDKGLAMGDGSGDGAGEGEGGGKKGDKGSGKGSGASTLRAAILARLAAMGAEDFDGDPGNGTGPHVPDRHRARRDPLSVTGSMRAPSQVTEGDRAIQAIRGLGRGTEPPASYREVFPSYDAAAEEGIADERIPAPRRAAVRRYFQSIRPDQP